MKLVLSALNRQVGLEQAKINKRKMMMENKDSVLFSEPLPTTNEEYLNELIEAIKILDAYGK